DAGAAEQHLAAVVDLDVDLLHRRADGVGPDLAVGLDADEDGALGHAIELLHVDAERAVEAEHVGADRLARRVGEADAAEAERVLERAVDQYLAEPVEQAVGEADPLAVENSRADAAGERHEILEHPAL